MPTGPTGLTWLTGLIWLTGLTGPTIAYIDGKSEIISHWPTGPLAHWPTDSTNYKEMLSHLKRILWLLAFGSSYISTFHVFFVQIFHGWWKCSFFQVGIGMRGAALDGWGWTQVNLICIKAYQHHVVTNHQIPIQVRFCQKDKIQIQFQSELPLNLIQNQMFFCKYKTGNPCKTM